MATTRIRFEITWGPETSRFWAITLLASLCVLFPPFAVRADFNHPAMQATITHGQRQFYVTKTLITANGAGFACEDGYHFASVWELADISNLYYNTTLGTTSSDSGSGPPTAIPFFTGSLFVKGWVRTGYTAYSSNVTGRANCANWTSTSDILYGTTASLPNAWVSGDKDVGVWDVETQTCDATLNRVWCIENSVMSHIFLPVVLK